HSFSLASGSRASLSCGRRLDPGTRFSPFFVSYRSTHSFSGQCVIWRCQLGFALRRPIGIWYQFSFAPASYRTSRAESRIVCFLHCGKHFRLSESHAFCFAIVYRSTRERCDILAFSVLEHSVFYVSFLLFSFSTGILHSQAF